VFPSGFVFFFFFFFNNGLRVRINVGEDQKSTAQALTDAQRREPI